MLFTSILPLIMSFFLNAPATTKIYTLSLHDALPIFLPVPAEQCVAAEQFARRDVREHHLGIAVDAKNGIRIHLRRSEEHTSELQSLRHLVCRLLLEKKKNKHEKHIDLQ